MTIGHHRISKKEWVDPRCGTVAGNMPSWEVWILRSLLSYIKDKIFIIVVQTKKDLEFLIEMAERDMKSANLPAQKQYFQEKINLYKENVKRKIG